MRNIHRGAPIMRRALILLLAVFWAAGFQVSTAAAATTQASSEASETASAGSSGVAMEAVALDVLILRPMGLLATVAGTGFFVASLPISFATQQVGDAKGILVDEPFENTFERPLGRI